MLRAVLWATVVHTDTHTDVSSFYSSLDWVLSHWVHFSVRRFICVCQYVFYVLYTAYVVLAYCEHGAWGGPDGIEALSLDASSFSAVTLLVGSFDL